MHVHVPLLTVVAESPGFYQQCPWVRFDPRVVSRALLHTHEHSVQSFTTVLLPPIVQAAPVRAMAYTRTPSVPPWMVTAFDSHRAVLSQILGLAADMLIAFSPRINRSAVLETAHGPLLFFAPPANDQARFLLDEQLLQREHNWGAHGALGVNAAPWVPWPALPLNPAAVQGDPALLAALQAYLHAATPVAGTNGGLPAGMPLFALDSCLLLLENLADRLVETRRPRAPVLHRADAIMQALARAMALVKAAHHQSRAERDRRQALANRLFWLAAAVPQPQHIITVGSPNPFQGLRTEEGFGTLPVPLEYHFVLPQGISHDNMVQIAHGFTGFCQTTLTILYDISSVELCDNGLWHRGVEDQLATINTALANHFPVLQDVVALRLRGQPLLERQARDFHEYHRMDLDDARFFENLTGQRDLFSRRGCGNAHHSVLIRWDPDVVALWRRYCQLWPGDLAKAVDHLLAAMDPGGRADTLGITVGLPVSVSFAEGWAGKTSRTVGRLRYAVGVKRICSA